MRPIKIGALITCAWNSDQLLPAYAAFVRATDRGAVERVNVSREVAEDVYFRG